VVTITKPTSGATVSGTILVEASVISNLVVTGVQFKLDGNNLGAKDTAAPYSISWNTTNTNNGWHSLTAVAEAIGILPVTSDPVTVNVFNDTTPPTVTINQATGQPDPTNTAPINFTAVFSEPVSGFTGADLAITGTAGGTKTVAVSGGPRTYTVAVSGMTDGTVNATIPAGGAQDAAGNTNTASTSTDNQVVFDATAPAPPSIPDLAAASDSGVSNTDNLTNDNTPTFTGTAEAGSTVKIFSDGAQVGTGPATGGAYSITTNPLSDGAHSITATATDAVNNVSPPSGALSVTIDTTRPTVAINSPMSGAEVSGTTTVHASASDNVGVIRVQFFVDMTTLIGEGTSNDFEVAWDTTKFSNGSHTLTAGARDAAGNQTTSAQVTVMVSNGSPAPTITSFTPTSGSVGDTVTISGTNFTGASDVRFNGVSATSFSVSSATTITATVPTGATTGPLSVPTPGGTATSASAFTVEEGPPSDTTRPTVTINQATGQPDPTDTAPINFTVVFNEDVSGFTGTDVAITGTAGGTKTMDVSGGPRTYTVAVSGMTDGTVIATIPAGGAQDAAGNTNTASTSTDNSVTFQTTAPPQTVTRFEESAEMFTGTGWVARGPEIATFSGGGAASSDVAEDKASFTFTGTQVIWIGLKCSVCGVASVSIDDGPVTMVDTAGPADIGSPGLTSVPVFESPTLTDGPHTIVITVTGSTTSGGAHVVVDAFDVTGASTTTRIEETDLEAISHTGNWITFFDSRASGGSYAEAFSAGEQATLSFTGTAVTWISARSPFTGIARVFLDGILQGEVDTYAPSEQGQVRVFTADGLPRGPHTLTIEATGSKNPAAESTPVIVDAFDVTP
jgi:hypothetical protein